MAMDKFFVTVNRCINTLKTLTPAEQTLALNVITQKLKDGPAQQSLPLEAKAEQAAAQ